MKPLNELKLTLWSKSTNESFSRVAVAAFLSQLDPTIEEINDIKTAVSEAVTNSIIHGYPTHNGSVYLHAHITGNGMLEVSIQDQGVGIADIAQAMQPFFSSDPCGERSGMGFTVMKSFMDHVQVSSDVHSGTTVHMRKQITQPQDLPAPLLVF